MSGPEMKTPRMDWAEFRRLTPETNSALLQLSKVAAEQGFDKPLLELVKIRVSQMNQCAFCLSMHVDAALRLGVPAEKLHLLAAWREVAIFDARERAALAWAEAQTSLSNGISDELYAEARAVFDDRELALLSSTVVAINAWNRIAVAYRFPTVPISETKK